MRPPALGQLVALVERGTTLLLVPGSATEPDWPGLRARFSPIAPMSEPVPGGLEVRPVPGYEQTLPDAAAEELARATVRRRLLVSSPAEGVELIARYADGELSPSAHNTRMETRSQNGVGILIRSVRVRPSRVIRDSV